MKLCRKKNIVIACLAICLLMQVHAFAQQQYTYAAAPLLGDSIKSGKALAVRDTVFYDNTLNTYIAKTFSRNVIISLSINEAINKQIPDTFTVAVIVGEAAVNESGATITTTDTLTIAYSKNNPYNSKAVRMFKGSPGYPAAQVLVKNITVSGSGATLANVRPFLRMDNMIVVNRTFKTDCSAITTLSSSDTSVATAGELSVSWMGTRFTPVYDLEWTYIDKSALDAGNYNTGGQPDAGLIFKNNASRITTTFTQYRIPLLYDGNGSLFWRVRSVQYAQNGELVNSTWSSDAAPSGLGRYDFTGHERKLNWQATTSFAEEGKRKSVVQYFDGSLKGRQTVTKDNTTGTTIVAETFYDKQGRPSIQVLPAPTLDRLIKYTPNFNTVNNAEYDKNRYDSLLNLNDFCSGGAPGMDTGSGASKYYSAANPLLGAGNAAYNKFIPDAKKYPFTETRYTRDNTGRIDRQGGVGDSMRIGIGHETKYYYGTPTQEDLDALFGTEAGDFSHYQKNMVRDANGQYSVSYVDMSGHTVATALTGAEPTSLQRLGNYSFFRQTDSILTPTNNIIKDGTIQMSNSMLVPQEGDYNFHYNLVPESLGLADCKDSNICYDCLYDLTITITDQCGNPPAVLTRSNFKLFKSDDSTYNLDTTCAAALSLVIDTSIRLKEGNYDVSKTLSISQASMAYYRDSIFMKHNTCKTYTSFALSQMDSLRLYLDCTTDSATSYLTDSYRSQMLEDVRPLTGQYGDTATGRTCFSVFNPAFDDEHYPFGLKPAYQTIDGYKDEDGNPDYVMNANGGLVPPRLLSPAEFIANFKDSWLDALIVLHPEYSLLLQHEKLRDADVWESDFLNTETYDSAFLKGYLNPTGSTAAPANKFIINKKDPLVTYSFTTNAKANLEDSLFNYTQSLGLSSSYSLWQSATAIVKCADGSNTCMTQWATNANAFDTTQLCKADLDQAWRIFRSVYLTKRSNWIDNYTKSAANINYTPPPGCTAVPVFPSSFALAKTGSNTSGDLYGGYSGTAGDTTVAKSNLQAYLYNNCKAYASRWWQQLAPCGYTLTDSALIMPYLVQVCYEGSDADHPLGSSTVKPASTYSFRSFEQVIAWYNSTHGPRPSTCSAYLIDKPTTYDQPSIVVNKPLLTAPDACTCGRINDLYNGYLVNTTPYGSFSGYMQMVYHTTIAQTTLDSLRSLCSGTINCRYLQTPIIIPPALQCNTGDVCASCYTVQSWKDSFTAKYPSITPKQEEADSTQHLANQVFANYMNLHLGFSKSSFEYLSFLDSCPASAKLPPQAEKTGGVCDSLNNIISQFDCYYKSLEDSVANKGMCGQTYWQSGSQNGYNPGAASYYSTYLPEIIRDSTLVIPAPSENTYNGGFKYSLVRPICLSNEVTIEYRVKNPVISCTTCPGDVAMGFSNHSINNDSNLQDEDFYFDMLRIAYGGFYTYRHGSQILAPALNNRNFDDWHTVKLKMTTDYFTVYFDNTSILSVARDKKSFIDQLSEVYMPVWGESGRALDWLKISVPGSGGTDQQVYFEDFTGPTTMSRPVPSSLCPKPTCQDAFANLYNKTYGTGYTYNDLSTKAAQSCNAVLNVCNPAGNGKLIGTCDSSWTVYKPADTGLTIPADYYTNSYNNIPPVSQYFGNSLFTPPTAGNTILVNKKDTIAVGVRSNNIFIPDTVALVQWRVHIPGTAAAAYVNPILHVGNDTYTGATWVRDPSDPYGFVGTTRVKVSNGKIEGLGLQSNGNGLTADWVRVSLTFGYQLYFEDFTGICGTTAGGTPYAGTLGTAANPLLCDKRAADSIITMDFSPCRDTAFEAAKGANFYYEFYQLRLRNDFNKKYTNKCLSAVNSESFTVSHPLNEYQYTLYYYDEAGNLVKTVPPAGVNPVRDTTWLNSVKAARRKGQPVTPSHTMPTTYRYNSLNQVVSQQSPDGGVSRYWYDILGRLVVSQNAKQKGDTTFSYTLYDKLGRITETGQKKQPTVMTDAVSRSPQALQTWLNYTYTANGTTAIAEQVTATVYDQRNPQSDNLPDNNTYILNPSFQRSYTLRNRVSYTRYYDVLPWNSTQGASQYSLYDNSATYSYDIHGNVDTLLMHYRTGVMKLHGNNQFKTIAYDYDLISGKVNNVYYQPGWNDAMTHRYEYDAENRLTNVYTTDLSGIEEQEARYFYYKHGPLAKAIIGQQQVQGMNYVYTLQGWLKALNPDSTIEEPLVARSAFNYSLHYYNNDYTLIGSGTKPIVAVTSGNTNFKPLYNGNIGAMAVNIKQFNQPLIYTYGYDQLNRLISASTYNGWNGVSTFSPSLINDYKEQITYDPNGNILKDNRNGTTAGGNPLAMDNMTYQYPKDANGSLVNNRLRYVYDSVGAGNYPNDIDNQTTLTQSQVQAEKSAELATDNYRYDAIGNLVKDVQGGINSVTWTVYGKIKTITKSDGTTITYTYDAAGNRIGKGVTKSGITTTTWYVRDAQGSVMAVYTENTVTLKLTEQHLYGSSRLGILNKAQDMDASNINAGNQVSTGFTRGMKNYELTNHLGNVLVAISDKRYAAVVSGGNITAYRPDVISANDNYPFGMQMPQRSFSASSYRYGFNGKEKDNDINSTGTDYDYGKRIYDPRLGKFLSTDPLQKKYPFLTPYQFAGNRPIDGVDVDGLENYHYTLYYKDNKEPILTFVGVQTHKEAWYEYFDYLTDNWQSYNGDEIKGKKIYVHYGTMVTSGSVESPDRVFNSFKELFKWRAGGFKSEEDVKAIAQENDHQALDAKMAIYYSAQAQIESQAHEDAQLNDVESEEKIEPSTSRETVSPETKIEEKVSEISGDIKLPGTSPKFDPNKKALVKNNLSIPASKNGYAPDFSSSADLYPTANGQLNIVKIKLTGSYKGDFAEANRAAGINGVKAPKGYTWHHMDDYQSSTGMTTMQLIKTTTHQATIPHTGSVKQYETVHKTEYKQ